jgi:hypothetical protein
MEKKMVGKTDWRHRPADLADTEIDHNLTAAEIMYLELKLSEAKIYKAKARLALIDALVTRIETAAADGFTHIRLCADSELALRLKKIFDSKGFKITTAPREGTTCMSLDDPISYHEKLAKIEAAGGFGCDMSISWENA